MAFLAIIFVTIILVIGIKESANFNSGIVIVKLAIVLMFIVIAGLFAMQHPDLLKQNWHPFIPPNQGAFGEYGWSGIARGASVIFFAYIGFDAVSTAAQEAKNPQKDMPIGILGSLVICTVLYILVAGLLTGIVPYADLNVSDPVAVGIDATGVRLGQIPGEAWRHLWTGHGDAGDAAGPVARVLLDVARRLAAGWASAVHPRFRTPWISTTLVGGFVAIFAS